jgi:hypothetical protein
MPPKFCSGPFSATLVDQSNFRWRVLAVRSSIVPDLPQSDVQYCNGFESGSGLHSALNPVENLVLDQVQNPVSNLAA